MQTCTNSKLQLKTEQRTVTLVRYNNYLTLQLSNLQLKLCNCVATTTVAAVRWT